MKVKIIFKDSNEDTIDCTGMIESFREEPYTDPKNVRVENGVVVMNSVYTVHRIPTITFMYKEKEQMPNTEAFVFKDKQVVYDVDQIVSIKVDDLTTFGG